MQKKPYISKYSLVVAFAFLWVCFACQPSKIEHIPLAQVVRDTYLDQLTLSGVLESSNSNNITCPSLRVDAIVVFLIPDGTYVKKGDTLCILESREIENQYQEALRNLETSNIEYNKSKAYLNLQYLMLKAQVATIETATSIKQLDSVQLRFSTPVRKQLIELELQKSAIEKGKILKQLEFLKRINDSELQKMKLKIKQHERRVASAKEKLEMLTIISKSDGLALRAKVSWRNEKVKEGDIVWDLYL
jgi:HlyD family secretion protein